MKKLLLAIPFLTGVLVACPDSNPNPNPNPNPTQTLSSIVLVCNPTSVAIAATAKCSALGKDSSGTNLTTQPAFTFKSSDPGKAMVSSAGTVTGVAAGSSSITASSGGVTSNAVAAAVTAAPSAGGVRIISTDRLARGRAISANAHVFFANYSAQYVYDGTISKELPALPSGYQGISFNALYACIDSNGNVAFVGSKKGFINHSMYYDATANSIAEIPVGDEILAFGCNDSKQVVGSDFNSGQKTHFKWQANDASVTQLSRQSPDSIIGYRPLGFNNAGTILFPDGILKGTTFTPMPLTSTFGTGLTNAGTVYALCNNQQLCKWNEGDAAFALLGTVPGPIQDSNMILIGVNNSGDVLLRAVGLASSTDYQYWLYKNGVFSRIVIPNYTIRDLVGISDDGFILANIFETKNFTESRVALFKP